MSQRLLSYALLVANFVTGSSVIGVAGMLQPLAQDLGVPVTSAGHLITAGAVVLCIGSPLIAWATGAADRRRLLAIALAGLVLAHLASALAPNYATLFGIRLFAMAFACVITPLAASVIASVVPERERAAAIAFVFLGWAFAAAGGLPLITTLADFTGWRSVHIVLGAVAALGTVMVWRSVPSGLRGTPMSFAAWGALLRSRLVVSLLAATAFSSAGQFVVFTYYGPLMTHLAGATSTAIAICFALFGIAGLAGSFIATRIVGRIGAYVTAVVFFAAIALGSVLWTLGSSVLIAAGAASAVWGFGFAAANSMQQARLAGAAPAMAASAVALNSSAIYVGQAAGSSTGSLFYDAAQYVSMGWAASALALIALLLVASTRGLTGLRGNG